MTLKTIRGSAIAAVFALAGLLAQTAYAYVFNLSDATIAPFIRGTAADTLQSSQAYSRTSGSQTNFLDGVNFGFSGEFGMQFNLSDQFSVRLGLEGYEGKSIDANGTRASDGAQLMTVNSLATVWNPNLGIQYNLVRDRPNGRVYLLLDGGYAMATVANTDNFTSTGLTQYGASSNINEKWSGTTTSYVAGLGAEYRAFQNTSIALEAGYRGMQFNQFTYAAAGSAVRGSGVVAVSKGATVTDNGGGRVSLDMSGVFVGVVFRFYLPPMGSVSE